MKSWKKFFYIGFKATSFFNLIIPNLRILGVSGGITKALRKSKDLINDDNSQVIDFEAGTLVSINEVLLIEFQKYSGGQ